MTIIRKTLQIKAESGFALLMTLIVVSVVLSIGLAILQLSIKQVQLSTMAKDSEVAFHAANAGMECARYVRRTNASAMENGLDITPSCFGNTLPSSGVNVYARDFVDSANGEVHRYQYQMTWGATGAERCTSVITLVASTTFSGAGLSMPNAQSVLAGYPSPNFTCDAGGRCTVISVRGYNKPCPAGSGFPSGTIQREVLVEF